MRAQAPEQAEEYRKAIEILNSLREFLFMQGFDSIHLKFSPEFEGIRPFTWNGWDSKVHYTHYLDLKEDLNDNIQGQSGEILNPQPKQDSRQENGAILKHIVGCLPKSTRDRT